jgi:hypothetical protein
MRRIQEEWDEKDEKDTRGLGMRKMRRTRAERRMIRIYEAMRRSINIEKYKVDDKEE